VISLNTQDLAQNNAIHCEMHSVYGGSTETTVHVCCKMFAHGQESAVDKE